MCSDKELFRTLLLMSWLLCVHILQEPIQKHPMPQRRGLTTETNLLIGHWPPLRSRAGICPDGQMGGREDPKVEGGEEEEGIKVGIIICIDLYVSIYICSITLVLSFYHLTGSAFNLREMNGDDVC